MRVQRLYQAEVDAAEADWQQCDAAWAAARADLLAVPDPAAPVVGVVQPRENLWEAARFEAANAQKRTALAEQVHELALGLAEAARALQGARRRLEMAARLEARAQRQKSRLADRRAAQRLEDDWRLRHFGAGRREGG